MEALLAPRQELHAPLDKPRKNFKNLLTRLRGLAPGLLLDVVALEKGFPREQRRVLEFRERGALHGAAPAAARKLVPALRADEVALRAVGPKDWPHVLLDALRVGGGPPRQLRLGCDLEALFEEMADRVLEVERVKVHALRKAAVQELQAHGLGQRDAVLLHGGVVLLDRLNGLTDACGDVNAEVVNDSFERFEAVYREYAWDDGESSRNARLAALLDEVGVCIRVIKDVSDA
mmetsp:Transcript_22277/g.71205  ORF Transcript_22277/g.71205 Transcript_22277/m.71205 type:complete len:233 (+) Transcript_22277:2402-3100(+)